MKQEKKFKKRRQKKEYLIFIFSRESKGNAQETCRGSKKLFIVIKQGLPPLPSPSLKER